MTTQPAPVVGEQTPFESQKDLLRRISTLEAENARLKGEAKARENKYAWLRSESICRGAFTDGIAIDDAYHHYRNGRQSP